MAVSGRETSTRPADSSRARYYIKKPYTIEKIGVYAWGIIASDPFETLDEAGVGALVQEAVAKGRRTKPDLELGVCGEHAGDPTSIAFFAAAGIDYLSCSPPRVPVARLEAGRQALLTAGAHATSDTR